MLLIVVPGRLAVSHEVAMPRAFVEFTSAALNDDLGCGLPCAVLELDVEAVVEPHHLPGVQTCCLARGRGPRSSRRYGGHRNPVTGQPHHAHRTHHRTAHHARIRPLTLAAQHALSL